MNTIEQSCQRWIERQVRWRSSREVINPSEYGLEVIDKDMAARDFIVRHHYSGSYPAARLRVGLHRRKQGPAPTGTELVGVAVFSVPMQAKAITARCGVPAHQGVELGRFVLLDSVPGNGETWFLSRAFKVLRMQLPEVHAVLSYADPVERRDAQGNLIKPGHIGVIYQALGANYLGLSHPRSLYLNHRGEIISPRAICKLRNGEQGKEYAKRLLLAAGAEPQEELSTDEWIVKSLAGLQKIKHKGNHVYTWDLNKPRQNMGMKYPKADQESL